MKHSPETLTALAHSWAGRASTLREFAATENMPYDPPRGDSDARAETHEVAVAFLEAGGTGDFELIREWLKGYGDEPETTPIPGEQEIVAPKPITLKVATFSPEFMAELAEMGIEMEDEEE